MTKFRSLIFREMRVFRKHIILTAILLFVMGAFYVVGIYAIKQDSTADGNMIESMVLMSSLTLAMISSLTCLFQNEVFKKDINVNWLRYSYTLPLTSKERAIIQVVNKNAVTIISMVLGLFFTVVYCHIADISFSAIYVTIYAIVYACGLIASMFSDLFLLNARSIDEYHKRHQNFGLTSLFICIAFVVVFLDKIKSFLDDETPPVVRIFKYLNGNWLIWLIPLIIVLIFADYLVIKNRMKNAFSEISIKKKAEKTTVITDTHDYPTGFFYKELKQNRLSIVLVAVMPILVTALNYGMLFFISLTENISLKTVMADGEYIITHYLCIAFGVYVASSLISGVFLGDDNKLWAFFTASTPNGVKNFMYNKYVLCFALTGLYMVISNFGESLYDTISFLITGKESADISSIYIIVFFALLFMNAVDIPFMVRFGQKKGSIIKTTLMLAISTAAVIIWGNLPYEYQDSIMKAITSIWNGEADSIIMLATGILPVICLVAYPLSYKISCILFMKGVNGYDK